MSSPALRTPAAPPEPGTSWASCAGATTGAAGSGGPGQVWGSAREWGLSPARIPTLKGWSPLPGLGRGRAALWVQVSPMGGGEDGLAPADPPPRCVPLQVTLLDAAARREEEGG